MYESIRKNKTKTSEKLHRKKTELSTIAKNFQRQSIGSLPCDGVAQIDYGFNLSATTKQGSYSNYNSTGAKSSKKNNGRSKRQGAHSQAPLNYERIFEQGGHYLESLSQANDG